MREPRRSIVILHVDDVKAWLDNVLREVKTLRIRGRDCPVTVLPCSSLEEAMDVVEGTDIEMKRLAAQGRKLDAVILDLMMGGGTKKDVDAWLDGVRGLGAGGVPGSLASVDEKCPALRLGRRAAERGAKVVILTNTSKFLHEERLTAEAEQRLIMAASGASAYLCKKVDGWVDKLKDTLVALLK